jgi:DnaJ-class molecular chaperone
VGFNAKPTIRSIQRRTWRFIMAENAKQDEVRHECDGCSGDGIYYGAGSVVNGVFKGFTGTCFRCQGKGYMTPADVKRCRFYDNRVRRFSVA